MTVIYTLMTCYGHRLTLSLARPDLCDHLSIRQLPQLLRHGHDLDVNYTYDTSWQGGRSFSIETNCHHSGAKSRPSHDQAGLVSSLVTDQAVGDQARAISFKPYLIEIQGFEVLTGRSSLVTGLVTDQAAGVTKPARQGNLSSNLTHCIYQVQMPVAQDIASELDILVNLLVKSHVKLLDKFIHP